MKADLKATGFQLTVLHQVILMKDYKAILLKRKKNVCINCSQ